MIYKCFVLMGLVKVMTSSKATITMISLEFTSASVISAVLILNNGMSFPITTAIILLTMFVCEGVMVLSLMIYPVLHSGPTPRELCSTLF